jgi:NAD(P)-dependent dehydrogenase (short-subunit alcohol dehydrogenase family)
MASKRKQPTSSSTAAAADDDDDHAAGADRSSSTRPLAVVTGASGVFGAQLCSDLSKRFGYDVIAVVRGDQSRGLAVPGVTGAAVADMASPTSIASLASQLPAGRAVQLLVNNAAVCPKKMDKSEETGEELQVRRWCMGCGGEPMEGSLCVMRGSAFAGLADTWPAHAWLACGRAGRSDLDLAGPRAQVPRTRCHRSCRLDSLPLSPQACCFPSSRPFPSLMRLLLLVQWCVNVLGYHRVTRALAPRLAPGARVVFVASNYAGGANLDDPQFERRRYDVTAVSKPCA